MTEMPSEESRKIRNPEFSLIWGALLIVGAVACALVVPGGGVLVAIVALFTPARTSRVLIIVLFVIGVVFLTLDVGVLAQQHPTGVHHRDF